MIKNKFYIEHNGMELNNVRRRAINNFNELVYLGKIKLKIEKECFCGSKDFELLSRFDRYGLPFGTKICINCGLISQTINIEEDDLLIFYDSIYWDLIYGLDKEIEFSTKVDGVEEFLPYILEEISFNSKKIKILEIGVGEGNRIKKLADSLKNSFDLELYGSDFSTNALEHSKSKGINVIKGGLDKCLNIGKVDILIMSHVFEHLIDLKGSLNIIEKLVNHDSIIYVEVPGIIDLPNKKEYLYDYQDYSVLAHIHNFSLSTLANVFSYKGFKLKKGNEFVRAIFTKNKAFSRQIVSENGYNEVINAIGIAREKNKSLMKRINNPFRKYLKTLLKALLGK